MKFTTKWFYLNELLKLWLLYRIVVLSSTLLWAHVALHHHIEKDVKFSCSCWTHISLGMGPGHCAHCFNCRSVQKGQGCRNVGCSWVLPKERQASSAFFFGSRGNRDDLVHVMSPLLCTAVKAVTGESFRSRPRSCSMTGSVLLHWPISLGETLISLILYEKVIRLWISNCIMLYCKF